MGGEGTPPGKWEALATGLVSLLGVVFMWGGIWLLLDNQLPGGFALPKEVALAVLGLFLMVASGSFFPAAYMEAVVAADLRDDAVEELRMVERLQLREEGRGGSPPPNGGDRRSGSTTSGMPQASSDKTGADPAAAADPDNSAAAAAGAGADNSSSSIPQAGQQLQGQEPRISILGRLWYAVYFFVKESAANMGAVLGAVIFWAGLFNIIKEHTFESTILYNFFLVVISSMGVTFVVQHEDARAKRLRVMRQIGPKLSSRPIVEQIGIWLLALVCNVCQIALWKGVEGLCEDLIPWEVAGGFVLFLGGVGLLVMTNRFERQSGLISDLSIPDPLHEYEEEDDDDYDDDFTVAARRGRAGFCAPRCCRRLRRNFGPPAITAVELISVAMLWTGVEWYIWEDDYIPESWLRNVSYAIGGTLVLWLTGTFENVAGRASPMGVYKSLHKEHMKEEFTRLLSHHGSYLDVHG